MAEANSHPNWAQFHFDPFRIQIFSPNKPEIFLLVSNQNGNFYQRQGKSNHSTKCIAGQQVPGPTESLQQIQKRKNLTFFIFFQVFQQFCKKSRFVPFRIPPIVRFALDAFALPLANRQMRPDFLLFGVAAETVKAPILLRQLPATLGGDSGGAPPAGLRILYPFVT